MSATSHSSSRTESIRRRLDRQYLVVHPPAELDAETAPAFAEHLRSIEDNTDIVVDVRDLRFCDSSGIAALLEGERAAAGRDCTFTLSSPSPELDRLLRLCGLGDHFVFRRPGKSRHRRSGGVDPSCR